MNAVIFYHCIISNRIDLDSSVTVYFNFTYRKNTLAECTTLVRSQVNRNYNTKCKGGAKPSSRRQHLKNVTRSDQSLPLLVPAAFPVAVSGGVSLCNHVLTMRTLSESDYLHVLRSTRFRLQGDYIVSRVLAAPCGHFFPAH